MTPATEQRYISSVEKLSAVSMGLMTGDYQAVDLLAQVGVHLLMIEGFRNLTAVVVEGTSGQVEWVS